MFAFHLNIHAYININMSDYDKMTPLHKAAYDGQLADVIECLMAGDDVNDISTFKNQCGHDILFVTPLYLAVLRNHYDVCEYLIKNGAHTNIKVFVPKTNDTFTLQEMAFTQFNFKIFKLLNSKKCSSNQDSLNTPLISSV
jgi:ankyrin repeat protein